MSLPALLVMTLATALAADPPPVEAPPLTPPQVAEFVEADYPPAARAQGLEARVLLRLAIDETGAVTDAVVL